jgi:cysteine desulfurase
MAGIREGEAEMNEFASPFRSDTCIVKDPVAICLDANATTQPLEQVIDLIANSMRQDWGNPSSAHWLGGAARACLERARDGVTSLLPGTLPEGVIFTSGGTEANNAILSLAGWAGFGATLITTAVEHPSMLRPAERFARMGGKLVVLSVSEDGVLDPELLGRAVYDAAGPTMVSVQWANSETGVIQPMSRLISEARRARSDVFIHSDVAQAIGRVRIDFEADALDAVTFSGHKLHGPQGIGAMVLREHDPRSSPLILGGGQERGMRSGSQNVAGAAGLGLAMGIRAADFDLLAGRLGRMRDTFEDAVLRLVSNASVNGIGAPRVPNTSNILFPEVEAMELVARLEAKGLACSLGSACSSARPEPSQVLIAMGLTGTDAFSSVRFSFSVLNTLDEADCAARLVADTVGEIH